MHPRILKALPDRNGNVDKFKWIRHLGARLSCGTKILLKIFNIIYLIIFNSIFLLIYDPSYICLIRYYDILTCLRPSFFIELVILIVNLPPGEWEMLEILYMNSSLMFQFVNECNPTCWSKRLICILQSYNSKKTEDELSV